MKEWQRWRPLDQQFYAYTVGGRFSPIKCDVFGEVKGKVLVLLPTQVFAHFMERLNELYLGNNQYRSNLYFIVLY